MSMQVRLTIAICPCRAPVDTTAQVRHIELHPLDRRRWEDAACDDGMFVLHHHPEVLIKVDDDETDTGLGPGIVAVQAKSCVPFTVDVELSD